MAIVERPSNPVRGAMGSQSLAKANPPRLLPKHVATTMKGKGGSTKIGSAGSTAHRKLPQARGFKR